MTLVVASASGHRFDGFSMHPIAWHIASEVSLHAPTDEDGRVVRLRRQIAVQIWDQQTARARIRPDPSVPISPGSQKPSPMPLRFPIVGAAPWRRHP